MLEPFNADADKDDAAPKEPEPVKELNVDLARPNVSEGERSKPKLLYREGLRMLTPIRPIAGQVCEAVRAGFADAMREFWDYVADEVKFDITAHEDNPFTAVRFVEPLPRVTVTLRLVFDRSHRVMSVRRQAIVVGITKTLKEPLLVGVKGETLLKLRAVREVNYFKVDDGKGASKPGAEVTLVFALEMRNK
jgi:hypothetical protein